MPNGELRWTAWEKVRGLTAATFTGLLLTIATDVVLPALFVWTMQLATPDGGHVTTIAQVVQWAVIYLVFGSPIALACCFAFGSLALDTAERKGRTSYRDAALLGALTGLILAALTTGLLILNGLKIG